MSGSHLLWKPGLWPQGALSMETVPKPSLRPRTWWHNCFSIISFQSIGVTTILTQPSLKGRGAVLSMPQFPSVMQVAEAVLKDWCELHK